MTRDDIIRMAREADPFGMVGRLYAMAQLTPETLERFASLVAAAEREACAEACEGLQDKAEEARALDAANDAPDEEMKLDRLQHWSTVNLFNVAMRKCAAAIRARSTP